MKSLSGKIAVVTGGTRGIGKAIALRLASEGAHVIAIYARNRQAADELTAEVEKLNGKVTCLRGDLTDDQTFASMIEEIKKTTDHVDMLVHAAASGVHRAATELSLKHLRWTFEINVFAVHHLILALSPMMREGGRIVGITSHGGTRVIPYYTAVGASKGALESLFRHYAAEFAPKGISVNLVCPGMVLTDAVNAFPEKEQRIERTLAATPSKRLTTVDDVAGVVSFLMSEAGRQVIGQTLTVDGGKTLAN